MTARKKFLYMRVDGFKKTGTRTAQKKRNLKFLSRLRILFMAGKFNTGLFFMLLFVVNMKMCMPNVEPKCILCVTGKTAETQGVVTKVEVSSYGPKGYNDYDIYYSYTVEGKTYTGRAADSGKGLTYLENHAVMVDYSVKEHGCSCVRDMECLAEKVLFASVTGGALFLIGLIFMIPGIIRAGRASSLLEYGEITTGKVTGTAEFKKMNPFNFGGSFAIHRSITQYRITCAFIDASGKNRKCLAYARNNAVIKNGDSVSIIYDPDVAGNVIVIDALPGSVDTAPGLD